MRELDSLFKESLSQNDPGVQSELFQWGLRKIVFLSATLRQSSRILNGLAQMSEDWRIKFEFCVSPINSTALDEIEQPVAIGQHKFSAGYLDQFFI